MIMLSVKQVNVCAHFNTFIQLKIDLFIQFKFKIAFVTE